VSVVTPASTTTQRRARPSPDATRRSPQVSSTPIERDSTADTFAGYLAATAIFIGAIALAARPLPLSVTSIVLSLVATAMSGPRSARIAAISVGVATLSFILAMTIAVLTDRSLY
jgi:VIT1/CCC1 family predicted Fe2+/Mn2+ transporter